MTIKEPTLEWVRWQIERLLAERVLGGLSPERAARYFELCEQERQLIAQRDGTVPQRASAG